MTEFLKLSSFVSYFGKPGGVGFKYASFAEQQRFALEIANGKIDAQRSQPAAEIFQLMNF